MPYIMLQCIYIQYTFHYGMKDKGTIMNYLEAKIELLKETPQIPLKMLVIEIVALIGLASILVQIFA